MNFLKRILGYRDFWLEPIVRGLIAGSKDYDGTTESLESARSLLLFRTSKQHTWLVATQRRLYCILDDVRKPRPALKWSVPIKPFLDKKGPTQTIRSRPKSTLTGLVDIGDQHHNWLYTTDLFEGRVVEEAILDLMEKAKE